MAIKATLPSKTGVKKRPLFFNQLNIHEFLSKDGFFNLV